MERATALRNLLAEPGSLLVPGVFDAHSARHAVQAGFRSIYLSGSAIAMSQFGYPDIGLVTLSETVEQIRRIAAAVEVPVIVDMDTGYGNALNVLRSVREAEAAGAAAIQIEDQVFPKKCGHFEGKEVVPAAEMIGKIKAVVDARRGDLVIIGRTDARAVISIDEAISRGQAYAEAGADVIFIEAPESKEELIRVARSVKAPLLVNIVEGGKTPQLPTAELEEIGFKVVLYPTACIRAVAQTLKQLYQTLRTHGSTAGMLDRLVSFQERNQITGLAWYDEWARKFGAT